MNPSPVHVLVGLTSSCTLVGFGVAGCTGDGAEPSVDAATWTEHWDCGYGFTAANPEGTERLVIRPRFGGLAPEARVVELPSHDWEVVVELGDHFGARGFTEDHACTDLVDASLPEERVDERWEVVDGTLIIGPPDEIIEWPGTARVAAEDLVAEMPDGELVSLGTVNTRSDCWGCFAG